MSIQNILQPNNLHLFAGSIEADSIETGSLTFVNSNATMTQYNEYNGTLPITGFTTPATANYVATRIGNLVNIMVNAPILVIGPISAITIGPIPVNLRPTLVPSAFVYSAFSNSATPEYFSALGEVQVNGNIVLYGGMQYGTVFSSGSQSGPSPPSYWFTVTYTIG